MELKEDLSIMMNQNTPSYYETICKQEIADSLNITTAEMSEELPIQIVSTGLRDILIPIKNIDMVNAIKPNFEKVSRISSKYNTIGYHIFTLESLNGSNATVGIWHPSMEFLKNLQLVHPMVPLHVIYLNMVKLNLTILII